MTKKGLVRFLAIMGYISLSAVACLPTNRMTTDIKVDTAMPTRNIRGTEDISVSNCDSDTEVIKTLSSVTTVHNDITVDITAVGTDGSEYVIPESLKLQLELEIKNTYEPIYTNAISRLQDIKIKIIPGYQTVYTIQWEVLNYRDWITFSSNKIVYKVSYLYELIAPQLIYLEKNVCPGSAITFTQTPQVTSAPESTLALSPTKNTLTLRIDNFLYKGPHIGNGIIDMKRRSSGETFNIIAKNPRGDWFLVQATDGTKGWLYLGWVIIDFDLDQIPITTDYHPAPAPTAKPTQKPPVSYP